MSYDIIKSIVIRGNTVSITSAPSNVSPRDFYKHDSDAYSEIYRKDGMEGLLKAFAREIWVGNYHLSSNDTKIVKALNQAFFALTQHAPTLRYFLDEERGSEVIAAAASQYLNNQTIQSDVFAPYEALRSDFQSVLEIAKANPNAFFYSKDAIQKNRDMAKAYIAQCAGDAFFTFPAEFCNDKELAELALKANGTTYRQLDPNLRQDPDLTRLAFDSNLPGRPFYEHIPYYIPPVLRNDPAFMREIITLCPKLHLRYTPQILNDRDTAILAAQNCIPMSSAFLEFPDKYLIDPTIQEIMLSRDPDSREQKRLLQLYESRDLPAPDFTRKLVFPASVMENIPKPALDEISQPSEPLTPFRIAITETYVKEVEVYAKDEESAIQKAEEYYNDGDINLDYDNSGRFQIDYRGIARPTDLKLHDVYGQVEAAPECRTSGSLDDIIAKASAKSQQGRGVKNHEQETTHDR